MEVRARREAGGADVPDDLALIGPTLGVSAVKLCCAHRACKRIDRFKDGWSALGRFSWLYDPAVDRTERTPLAPDAKRIAAQDVTLLDLWVAKDFDVAGMPGKVKVGNQVLSWGEDIFIYGGVNIINPFDLTRAHKPGVQIKEIVRPVPMASFNLGVNKNWSVEGFWQFRTVNFRFDPVGTPFSIGDVIGNGQQDAFIPSSVLGEAPGFVGDPGTISNGAILPPGQRFTRDDLLREATRQTRLDFLNPLHEDFHFHQKTLEEMYSKE